MTLLAILLVSFGVQAADVKKKVDVNIDEDRISALSDDEAAALLAEEFGPAKDVEPATSVKVAAVNPNEGEKIGDKSQVIEAKGNLAENEIPVLTDAKKDKAEVQPSPFRKMALSLGIILAAILGLSYAARRWFVNKKTSTPTTQIRIISQHYLGPRKSLAIVYVAGESLLIGITDSQINLVKQLSLIDDEVPANLPKKFDETLDFAESVQPEGPDNFSMKGIKDLVSSKLKNMREI